jgi:hypothetical protein
MSPPRRIPKAELFIRLAALRDAGMTCKQITKALGDVYSFRYIQTLCGLLSIPITASVDQDQKNLQPQSTERWVNAHPEVAAPDSAQGNSPQTGTST